MQRWLIIDLRGNHCYIRLASEINGQVKWAEKPASLRVIVSVQTFDGDDRVEPQLCFFRDRTDKSKFRLIDPQELNKLPSKYEGVDKLFAEPTVISEELMVQALYSLFINESLKRYFEDNIISNLRFLCLVENNIAKKVSSKLLGKKLSGLSPEAWKVVDLSTKRTAFEGFALMSSQNQTDLPHDGQIYSYIDKSHPNEKQYLLWQENRFQQLASEEIHANKLISVDSDVLPEQFSGTDLERLGAVIYLIRWQPKFTEIQRKEIDSLKRQFEEYSRLLESARVIRTIIVNSNR